MTGRINGLLREPVLGGAGIALLAVLGVVSTAHSDASVPKSSPEGESASAEAPGPSPQEAVRPSEADSKPNGATSPGREKVEVSPLEGLRREALEEVRAARVELRTAGDPSAVKDDPLREAAMERLEQAESALKKAHASRVEAFLARPAEERRALEHTVRDHLRQQRADRSRRAKERRSEWREDLKGAEKRPEVRQALREHAWRLARLEQATFLAAADGQTELEARAKALKEREEVAFRQHLDSLLSDREDFERASRPAAGKAEKP